MGSLGELGTPKIREVDSFTWFGPCGPDCWVDGSDEPVHQWTGDCAEVRIGDVSDLLMVDFLMRARKVDGADEIAGLEMLDEAFRSIVHEADFERFWRTSLRNRQSTRDLMTLMVKLVEGVTDYPTERRSGSLPGRRSTGKKSRGDSSSRVMARFQRGGRADLALAVKVVQPTD